MTPTTQPAEHTKLLPCPFCGGPAAYAFADAGAPYPGGYPTVYCVNSESDKCLSDAYHCPGKCRTEDEPAFKATAIEMWNCRAGIPAPESAIEQAREALEFYANPLTWRSRPSGDTYPPTAASIDVGDIARAALSNLTPATDKQG